jgi:hypothetical protein
MVTSIVLSFIWGLSIVHLKFHGWKRLLKIAGNGLGLADVPALAFRQPKFITNV